MSSDEASLNQINDPNINTGIVTTSVNKPKNLVIRIRSKKS